MAESESSKKSLPILKIVGILLIIIAVAAIMYLAAVGNASNADPRSPEEYLIEKYTAPIGSDPIAGTWWGSKTTSLIILTWQVEGSFICYPNNTGIFSGFIRGPFIGEETFSLDFTWQVRGDGSYHAATETGTFDMKFKDDAYAGRLLSITMNPSELGISDLLSMDITIDMMPVR